MVNLKMSHTSYNISCIAELSNLLDDSSLGKYAIAVDKILQKLSSDSTSIASQIQNIIAFIDNYTLSALTPLSFIRNSQFKKLRAWYERLLSIISAPKIVWAQADQIMNQLQDSNLNYGNWTEIGELDLEHEFGDQFPEYIKAVQKLSISIKEASASATTEEQYAPRARQVSDDVRQIQGRAEALNKLINNLSVEAKSRGDMSPKEAERISQIYDHFDMTPIVNFNKLLPTLQGMTDMSPEYKVWVTNFMDKLEKNMGYLREALFVVE